MVNFIHSVLGTDYDLRFGDRKEIVLDEGNTGECRFYSKVIKVCTEEEDCSQEELEAKVQEIVAHEIFHAYLNEAGVNLDSDTEEMVACFFMKNWRKIFNSIFEVTDKSGYLTE